MPRKILVINGHGAKRQEQLNVGKELTLVTPGNAEESYILAFDDKERHLEEMTYKNKIWPIIANGNAVEWRHYQNTNVHDVDITPLQPHFNVKFFAGELLDGTIKWGDLTDPKHNVLQRGALAVRNPDNSVTILENQLLLDFLQQVRDGAETATPLFFCDKELGKIKPLGKMTLSEIYKAVPLMDEFKDHSASIIVATCSPNKEHPKHIEVQTKQVPQEISKVVQADVVLPTIKKIPVKETPVIDTKVKEIPLVETMDREQLINNSNKLITHLNLNRVKITPRIDNYIHGDTEHNKKQPIQSIQFDFETEQDRTAFKLYLSSLPGFQQGVVYDGFGFANQPIVQLSPQFMFTISPKGVPMTLSVLLSQVEKKVGSFSKYETDSGPAEAIPFTSKPAQQLLAGLGVTSNAKAPLSTKDKGVQLEQQGNPSVTVSSFVNPQSPDKLTISGKRIDRLIKSAKVYVNTDILPTGQYKAAIDSGTIQAQDQKKSPVTGIHWQNMAVGICHVQEIDLLVEQTIDGNGKAICSPRKGVIEENAPAMLLLSTPALNFGYGKALELSPTQQKEFIAGMFRNLFNTTQKENRKYIAMPAAGLGPFAGDPDFYFTTLMEVAKEFPDLNIIYHPAQFGTKFKTAFATANQPVNVIEATKDVMYIANELTQMGYPCAFHNPSDSDVVYGVYDVGEYWKYGEDSRYVGEEHIGAMTTGTLNSMGLNAKGYHTVIEHGFTKKAVVEATVNPVLEKKPEQPPVIHAKPVTPIADTPVIKTSPVKEVKRDDQVKKKDISLSLPKQQVILNQQAAKFSKLLDQLISLENTLDKKAGNKLDNINAPYTKAARAATDLLDVLTIEKIKFFANPTPETFTAFKMNCETAIKNASGELEQHRGWHKLHPVLKGILGVLAILTVLPALIVAATAKEGYSGTFFATPATASAQKLKPIAEDIEALNQDIAKKFS